MVKKYQIEGLGELKIQTNWFTGRSKFFINEIEAHKVSKKYYAVEINKEYIPIIREGNLFVGYFAKIKDIRYEILEKVQWYYFILIAINISIPLVLGTVPYFAQHGLYIVGGAIGGAIGGIFAGLALTFCQANEKWWLRLLVCLGCIATCFGVCLLIGNLIVFALANSF